MVSPVRRYIPAIGRLDTATVLIAFIVQLLALLAMTALARIDVGAAAVPGGDSFIALALTAVVKLTKLSVTLFIVAIFIRVILNLLGRYFGPISDMLVGPHRTADASRSQGHSAAWRGGPVRLHCHNFAHST